MDATLTRAWVAAEGAAAAMSANSAATVVELDLRAARSFYLRSGKRILDVIGASVALVLSAPILLLAALAIKLESRGPVLYRSTRIGRGGQPFTFLKLRSMVHNADQHRHRLSHLNECDGPVFKINRDPRVTRVGRFLRVTSIDEIPQFVNVLLGHMSMVGPRPPIPEEVVQYEPWQLRRLDVRPGITCLWQISGRSRIGFQEWMRLDLEYIRRQSLALDANILIRTVPAVLSREGAY
jgi:lipopolysaccharide/colanic/teichoic acid biosynthesis glycosyltransferase